MSNHEEKVTTSETNLEENPSLDHSNVMEIDDDDNNECSGGDDKRESSSNNNLPKSNLTRKSSKASELGSSRKSKNKETERAEKLKIKEEKEKQKVEEKERKQREKDELKLKKETEKQEKEREKEEKKRQKEEEKKLKQEQVEEEKKKKEEAKLEEKRKKEEEKKREEEKAAKKNQKEKQLMHSFFIKTARDALNTSQQLTSVQQDGPFRPFELKEGMVLAPRTRYQNLNLNSRLAVLDELLQNETYDGHLYLAELKGGNHVPGKSKTTMPKEEEDEVVLMPTDVTIGNPSSKLIRRRMKLLQFHDNYRPAYYGTWSKTSTTIRPRRPLGRDCVAFDYEVDSDEEWEEEEPGESISHSEGEDDNDDEPEDDDKNFYVPHGYLSEGEGCDDEDDLSPEGMKQKMLLEARAWEEELGGKQVRKLAPIVIGVVRWNSNLMSTNGPHSFLKEFMMQPIDVTFPIDVDSVLAENVNIETSTGDAKVVSERTANKKRLRAVPDEALSDLIRLVHGCSSGIDKMVKEFRHFWLLKNQPTKDNSNEEESPKKESPKGKSAIIDLDDNNQCSISKRQLDAKIREIAAYKRDSKIYPYKLWYVNGDVLDKYDMAGSPIPSSWEWVTAEGNGRRIKANLNANPETPKGNKSIVEMKTPTMTLTTAGILSTPKNSGIKRKLNSLDGPISKYVSPSGNAVGSERSAKKLYSEFIELPKDSAFSPLDSAALNSSFFLANVNSRRENQNKDQNGLSPTDLKTGKKGPRRISTIKVDVEKKIIEEKKNEKNDGEESQDCIVVESESEIISPPTKRCKIIITPLKLSNPEQLVGNNNGASPNLKIATSDGCRVELESGKPTENEVLSIDLTTNKNDKKNTIVNFFKVLNPGNK